MNLSNYRTGVASIDQKIIELLEEVPTDDLDLIAELLVSGVRLGLEDVNRGELILTNSALKELRHSFSVLPLTAQKERQRFLAPRELLLVILLI